jgi:hypothetical protein
MGTSLRLTSGLLAMVAALCACGPTLHGQYGNEQDGADFDFKSGSRVEITVLGSTRVGSYKLEDGKVYITAANDTQAFRFDKNGCIDGGFVFGTLCKRQEEAGWG